MDVTMSLNFRYTSPLYVADDFHLLMPCRESKAGTRYKLQCDEGDIIMYLNNAFLVSELKKMPSLLRRFYYSRYRFGKHEGEVRNVVVWPPELYSLTILAEPREGLRLLKQIVPLPSCKSEGGAVFCDKLTIAVQKRKVKMLAVQERAEALLFSITGQDYFTWLRNL